MSDLSGEELKEMLEAQKRTPKINRLSAGVIEQLVEIVSSYPPKVTKEDLDDLVDVIDEWQMTGDAENLWIWFKIRGVEVVG